VTVSRPSSELRLGGELVKLGAFVRRDFLVALSYRTSFVTSMLGLFSAAALFYFVGRIVDPASIPEIEGQRVSYVEFAVVGMALAGFVQFGLDRVAAIVRTEQMMGTLESLLATPTAPTTVQVGSVLFDLLFIPVRLAILLTVLSLAFGLHLDAGGIPAALVILVAFLPFVWGLGVAAAAITLTFRRGGGIVGFFALGLTMVSGAYFPVDVLPGWLQPVATASPVAIAVDALRRVLLAGAGWSGVGSDLVILAPLSVASLAVGMTAFRLALRRERRLGTLGAY
jgi:ABC-2 type transport system permease protein